ncbi:MAG: zinc-dependent alcohol dehydrogenase family protein [Calditrichaeota bacterium]|nr:zinc-dependent alcohol dehydrogenase family protein [Calditrichota bacterium]
MQALEYSRGGKLELIEKECPDIQPDEVLIRVAYAGICGTDLHILADEVPSADRLIPGHEFSGIIERVGEDVRRMKTGQKVAVDPNNHCDTCTPCKSGRIQFCENLKPIGVQIDGAWAEFCAVPAKQVHPLPDSMDLKSGALTEPVSCIVHGWDQLQPVDAAQSVLILGAGLIGLLWAFFLRDHGFTQITMVEPDEGRRKRGSELGFSNMQRQIEAGQKFDVIIDCSGNSRAIEQALPTLKHHGTFLFFGVCPQDARIKVNPFHIYQKEWKLIGSFINPFTFPRAVSWLNRFSIDWSGLGVEFFALSDYRQALQSVRQKRISKGIFRIQRG